MYCLLRIVCWLLRVGCVRLFAWLLGRLFVVCWLLYVDVRPRCWFPAVRCSLCLVCCALHVTCRCVSFAACCLLRCSLFVGRRLVVCRSLRAVCCVVSLVCGGLVVVCRLLSALRYLLFVMCCLLCAVRRLLFVDCRLLFVVCCS